MPIRKQKTVYIREQTIADFDKYEYKPTKNQQNGWKLTKYGYISQINLNYLSFLSIGYILFLKYFSQSKQNCLSRRILTLTLH